MFVCVCSAVSDREVERALDEGADSIDAVSVMTGAGTCCGSCRPLLLDIIGEYRCAPALAA
jgi:bacterioferritin-associated ferredoxin